MRNVIADAGTEVVANGARRGFLRIGHTHGVAPFGDGVFRFQDHGDNFAGAHEIGELAEKRRLAVDGVESAGFVFSQTPGPDGYNTETCFMNARKNLAL